MGQKIYIIPTPLPPPLAEHNQAFFSWLYETEHMYLYWLILLSAEITDACALQMHTHHHTWQAFIFSSENG